MTHPHMLVMIDHHETRLVGVEALTDNQLLAEARECISVQRGVGHADNGATKPLSGTA